MHNYHKYFNVTDTYQQLHIPKNTLYIYGISPEDRSNGYNDLQETEEILFCRINKIEGHDLIEVGKEKKKVQLRNLDGISGLIENFNRENIYIDVTGLDNRICAPLIKQCISIFTKGKIKSIRVIYSEPLEYDVKKFKVEGVFSDLSEKIQGIYPLPGFIKVFPRDNEDIYLIALLGFEGGRFMHLLEEVECTDKNVIPVIGLPGFRVEYPQIAFWGNQKPLKDTGSWRNIKYASANSAIEVYFLLKKLLKDKPHAYFKIAPIGTKPHAIGAMIFAARFEDKTELVYDNPIRKIKKTKGVGKVIECLVSELLTEEE